MFSIRFFWPFGKRREERNQQRRRDIQHRTTEKKEFGKELDERELDEIPLDGNAGVCLKEVGLH